MVLVFVQELSHVLIFSIWSNNGSVPAGFLHQWYLQESFA